ncbi:hypothetical protein NP233_g3857 [Leucocoprinus birnbaumii]|uniref:Uncharacterized protein n=1 Tax=Leucocoprinus birnbaumii TaxID=56174 RepID=A0AAD5VZJ0_9AGAR|nr:hypothetical protein NP233_g3857 [Leucocoprinus birnbaumii]
MFEAFILDVASHEKHVLEAILLPLQVVGFRTAEEAYTVPPDTLDSINDPLHLCSARILGHGHVSYHSRMTAGRARFGPATRSDYRMHNSPRFLHLRPECLTQFQHSTFAYICIQRTPPHRAIEGDFVQGFVPEEVTESSPSMKPRVPDSVVRDCMSIIDPAEFHHLVFPGAGLVQPMHDSSMGQLFAVKPWHFVEDKSSSRMSLVLKEYGLDFSPGGFECVASTMSLLASYQVDELHSKVGVVRLRLGPCRLNKAAMKEKDAQLSILRGKPPYMFFFALSPKRAA